MTERTRASWPVYALGALSAGAIVVAILVVGPAAGGSSAVTRTATAAAGVVQSTVSGSGNLQASSQLDLGFRTSGVVSEIYVSQGQRVTEGQLLAELNPKSAEVTLEQSRATLQAAVANLAQVAEDDGETSSGSGSGSNATAVGKAAAVSQPATRTPSSSGRESTGSSSPGSSSSSSSSSPSSSSSSSSSTSKAPESQATREANIASARAAVQSDKLSVEGDEQALADTKLYAPKTGTIVSLTGEVGENVSAQGTTKASSSSSSSGSGASGSGASAAGASASGRSATGSTSASSSSSGSSGSGSSSSAFAVLSDLASMQLVAPLSESEIGSVKVGQTATIAVEALNGTKLAAHVAEVATLSTSNSGVVSYDVTFQLDQMVAGLKPGMSATAEVVVKQAEGVNVPTSAISAGTVTVLHGSEQERRRVVTGLAGDSTTIVLSGLRAGEKVLLPSATGTAGTSSLSSRLGRALGGGGGGGALGGGGGGLGGSGGVFFRGGG
jgi:multidrug efflux pump subunit AcrA (membrane-fusion protein)